MISTFVLLEMISVEARDAKHPQRVYEISTDFRSGFDVTGSYEISGGGFELCDAAHFDTLLAAEDFVAKQSTTEPIKLEV